MPTEHQAHSRLEQYTKPERDRKSTLFWAILNRARAEGSLSDIEPILNYYLPNREEPAAPEQDTYLTNYRFDIVPSMTFGSNEGIFVNLVLNGEFDASGKTMTSIGVFKTLGTGLEACRRMGELCGILMYYGDVYVNENIHRYTPENELEAEYKRKLASAAPESGGKNPNEFL